jgi:hypothetical protein
VRVDDQFIVGAGRLETYGGACEQSIQVHGEGTIGRYAQCVIAVAPVFDEGDIWVGKGGGSMRMHGVSPVIQRILGRKGLLFWHFPFFRRVHLRFHDTLDDVLGQHGLS